MGTTDLYGTVPIKAGVHLLMLKFLHLKKYISSPVCHHWKWSGATDYANVFSSLYNKLYYYSIIILLLYSLQWLIHSLSRGGYVWECFQCLLWPLPIKLCNFLCRDVDCRTSWWRLTMEYTSPSYSWQRSSALRDTKYQRWCKRSRSLWMGLTLTKLFRSAMGKSVLADTFWHKIWFNIRK